MNGIAFPMYSKDPRTIELLSTLNFSFILLSGLFAFNAEKQFLRFTGIFFIVTIILEWLHYAIGGSFLSRVQPLATSFTLILLLVLTFRSILSARIIDQNVIFGVVAGYVLIGFVGGLIAIAIGVAYPGAFNNVEGVISSPEAVYFSFITMTTLGYGDITPAIQDSRSLAILLSIVGPMYVAIVIALMVGKFAARQG
jgi:hypothetical protein